MRHRDRALNIFLNVVIFIGAFAWGSVISSCTPQDDGDLTRCLKC